MNFNSKRETGKNGKLHLFESKVELTKSLEGIFLNEVHTDYCFGCGDLEYNMHSFKNLAYFQQEQFGRGECMSQAGRQPRRFDRASSHPQSSLHHHHCPEISSGHAPKGKLCQRIK